MTEYYHTGVVCYLVGYDTPVPMDVEMVQPGEGEVSAAKRLLVRVLERYPRFFDAVVGDAIYLEAPFVRFCLEHKVDVVAVLKNNQETLLTDANALLSTVTPTSWCRDNLTVCAWDIEGYRLGDVEAPIRVLHTEETLKKRERRNHEWLEEEETHRWWWATTFSVSRLRAKDLWQAAHARWEIENVLFHNLATYWALDHCYKHDPTAIENFILTLFLAYVLVQTFHHRNLKPALRVKLTVIGVADQIHIGLGCMGSGYVWAINLATPGP